jgi:hypothetical protein
MPHPVRDVLSAVVVAVLTAGASSSPPQTPAAESIARQVQDRDTGRDSRGVLRMKLFDRRGRSRERAMTLTTLRGRGNPGAAPAAPEGDRLLIRFRFPNDIRGTSFLVWEHPAADDERFLYLPSLGRVRRIAGAETQESFVGSDFTYEDIGGREFDEYTYAFAPDPSTGAGQGPSTRSGQAGSASWTAPGGGPPQPAWRLESRRKDAAAEFPRVVSLILKDSLVVVQADIFNRRNEKQKVYTVKRLERIEGIWTVMESGMTNDLEKTRTELVVESIDYNVGLKESDFARRELERGAGRIDERAVSPPSAPQGVHDRGYRPPARTNK